MNTCHRSLFSLISAVWDYLSFFSFLNQVRSQIRWNQITVTDDQIHKKAAHRSVPGTLLEGVDDLSILAELADETFLSTQTAAENMGAGKLDHLGQEGSQLSIYHLEGEEGRKEGHGRYGQTAH